VPTGLKHGTVTIVTGKGEASHVEVTTFRGEGAYTDARRPDHVTFGVPLVEDLARRDLRVNAMAYDPVAARLIDPYNGLADIAERVLRAVGPTGDVYADAVARFTEDGLRVMRAVRFAAQLEFALDADTERGIPPALGSLAKVSRERVSDELRKILATRAPSRALAPAERTGIIASIAPELAQGFDAWSATDHRARVDHWLARIDAAPADARLGAMFFELAPPAADLRRLDRPAVELADRVLRGLKFSNDEIRRAATLVGTASATLITDWTDPDLRRLLADVTRAHAAAAAALWSADGIVAGMPADAADAATRLGGTSELADRARSILKRGDAIAVNELAVTGKDLMTALDMPAGPALGRILAVLLERVLDDPALNTAEALIAIARGLELELAR
jgi:tRNA nucleotidyltransferase (CCA-adding enzyme)